MEPETLLIKFFEFYGVRVKLNTDSAFIAENINRDFSYFQKEFAKKPDIEVFSFYKEPPKSHRIIKFRNSRLHYIKIMPYAMMIKIFAI
jgi:hypothetical protein